MGAKKWISIRRSAGMTPVIARRKRSRVSVIIVIDAESRSADAHRCTPRAAAHPRFCVLNAARVELTLHVQPQDVHEILRVGDDAECLMRAAILELAHDE